MAQQRMVSPGVFTSVTDISYLSTGVGAIGAGIIGPTKKGRAFIPTQITSNNENIVKYGGKYDDSYVPFTVESYMNNAGVITITRLLGLNTNGYTENIIPLVVTSNGNKYLGSVLHHTRTVDSDTTFKTGFLTNATLSSSYVNYSNNGTMTSLNANINLTGSIAATDFVGVVTGHLYNATVINTIISASGADLYVSASLTGNVSGLVQGTINGVPVTQSVYPFTGSVFDGIIRGTATLTFTNNPTKFYGTVTSATVTSGSIGVSVGTISGSAVTTLAAFTSSIVPQSSPAFTASGNSLIASDFYFKLANDWYNTSFNSTDPKYIGKVFGNSPKTTMVTQAADDKDKAYNYILFDDTIDTILANDPLATVSTASIDFEMPAGNGYSPSETPWITSQYIGGKAFNLFKIVDLNDGDTSNQDVKIGIINIKHAGEVPGSDYGTFDIVVRDINDTDRQQNILETWSGLSLDKDSPSYICRIIGDKYPVFTVDTEGMSRITMVGDYDNNSFYIRIVADDNIINKAYDPALIPFGFKAYRVPFNNVYLNTNSIIYPTTSFVTDQLSSGEYSSRVYYGFNFDYTTCDNDMYLLPLPSGSNTGSNADFNMDNMIGNVDSGYSGSLSSTSALLSQRKFIVALQNGFDGWSPARPKLMGADIASTNTMGLDCSTGTTDGSKAYKYAINLLGNSMEYDINLLFTPGIIRQLHPSIVNAGIDMCEDRGDVFYLFDVAKLTETNLTTIVNQLQGIDTNMAATYHPWLKYLNTDTNQFMWVPPTVLMAGVFSFNDKVGYEWFAPAGMNRGGIPEATDVYTKLYRSDMNTLYENRINPIITERENGMKKIVAWGQKTLQSKKSAMDRINVSRLLINAIKYVASTAKYLNFEQNTIQLQNQFLNVTNPYFESVQQKQGLYSFKVVCDNSNNGGDVLDRNELIGNIQIKPTKTAEIIRVNFTVTNSGATFS